MKRKLNSRVYELYFDGKYKELLLGVNTPALTTLGCISYSFPSFTYTDSNCRWNGKDESTFHVTILDDNGLGHSAMLAKCNEIVQRLHNLTNEASEVLLTVTKCEAHFLNAREWRLR